MVTIVTIGGKKYLVDVGVGNHGPTFPVPLVEGGFESMNVKPTHKVMLRKDIIPDDTHSGTEQQMWIYSLRFDKGAWTPGYCFSEVEFLPQDFETMNFFVLKSPQSWFTYHVVALKFLMEDEEIVGDITFLAET